MGDHNELLEEDYCPPIDPPLFRAIICDFDLSTNDGVREARSTLDLILENARTQRKMAPPGCDDGDQKDGDQLSEAKQESYLDSEAGSSSDLTNPTDVSNEFRATMLWEDSNKSRSEEVFPSDTATLALEQLDDESKLYALKQMFPFAGNSMIRHLLKKSDGNYHGVIDQLLNHALFERSRQLDSKEEINAKGIESFAESHLPSRGRKPGRQKNDSRAMADEFDRITAPSPESRSPNPYNAWETGSKDIDFISQRMNVPRGTISSYFHQSGTSVRLTITSLLDADPSKIGRCTNAELEMSMTQAQAFQLSLDYPSIEITRLESLVRLTHPSLTAAHDIARILTPSNKSNRKPTRTDLIPTYEPISRDLECRPAEDPAWTEVINRRASNDRVYPPSSSRLEPGPNERATFYSEFRSRARTQAAHAARRGRSDHLMRSAAGYYGQVARDYAVKDREATADAADQVVKVQSSPGMIDLHGISAKDAVRITRAKLTHWWQTESGRRVKGMDGRTRVEGGRGGAKHFDIVTGTGQHSAGGRAVIGPAVRKMLMNEGWDAGYDNGVWTVYGKM